MASDRILEQTRQADLQPLVANGVPVFRVFGQLRAELLGALSRAHLDIFAEPNADPATGDIQWYAPVPGRKTRLVDCAGEQRERTEIHLARLVDDILAHAKRLRLSDRAAARDMAEVLELALEVASESHVFLVGDQPVLSGWGHVPRGPAAPQRLLTTLVARVRPAVAPPADPPPAAPGPAVPEAGERDPPPGPEPQPVLSPEPEGTDPPPPRAPAGPRPYARVPIESGPLVVGAPRLRWLGPVLWTALTLILLAIGNLLLQHCAIGWPVFAGGAGVILDYCPVSAAAAQGGARNRALLAALQAADQTLKDRRRQCSADASLADDARSRVERENKTIGAVNVVLTWNTLDDLDLHVTCPNAETINYERQQSCGGVLDIDKNNDKKPESMTNRPVESIKWEKDRAQAGTYKVEVNPFRISSEAPVEFRVDLFIDGRTQPVETRKGRFEANQSRRTVMEFKLPYEQGR